MRRLWPIIVMTWGTGCLVPDSMVDAYLDRDGDGEITELVGGTDCNDDDPSVGKRQAERCGNGIDDNCDERIDDAGVGALTWYDDDDGDGYGDPAASVLSCTGGADLVKDATDCDDDDKNVHPGALEDCANGVDDNCNGFVDEATGPTSWFRDADGDDYGAQGSEPIVACTRPDGYAANAGDCDDRFADTFPNAPEIPYDGRDNGCDGGDDLDLDGDGFRVDPAFAHVPIQVAWVPDAGEALDCDDLDAAVNPVADETWYNGVDNDCDGWDDDDQDRDGYAAAARGGTDCDDLDDRRHPGRAEVFYDGVDDDCDPSNDDDQDGDGFASDLHGGTDCDDTDPFNWTQCATCRDADRDGRRIGCDAYPPLAGPDCDDTDPDTWASCATCGDVDGDGFRAGCDAYVDHGYDCDDTDARVWQSCESCADLDGDGWWAGCDATTLPVDCDDQLANAWSTCGSCTDTDGDLWGVGTCDDVPDCNDDDIDVWFSCATCRDDDEDWARTGCDAYEYLPFDCDDTDPVLGGHTLEILGDGIDQDCSGSDLVVDEVDGVFVATSGVDAPDCGSRVNPCATPAYAAPIAKAAGKVLFLAEGTYGSFSTAVSVYGGFEDVGWGRNGGESEIAGVGGEYALRPYGAAVRLDGIAVELGGVRELVSVIKAESSIMELVDVRVAVSAQAEECTLVRLGGLVAMIERLAAVGGATSARTVGISAGLQTSAVAVDIRESSLLLDGQRPSSSAVALEFNGHALRLHDADFEVAAGFSAGGLDVDLNGAGSVLALSDSSLVTRSSGPDAWGLSLRDADQIAISTTLIDVESGGTATGFRVQNPVSSVLSSSLAVTDSVISSRGPFSSVALDIGLSPPQAYSAVVMHTSILATGADAVGTSVYGGELGVVDFVNVAFKTDTVGIATSTPTAIHGVAIEAPCAYRRSLDWRSCDRAAAASLLPCDWLGCEGATVVLDGAGMFDVSASLAWIPSGVGPLVDTGVDSRLWGASSVDLYGAPRPQRAWFDIGAVELP